MNYTVDYEYTEGYASYTIVYGDYRFIGEATCHLEDMDFVSERVGLTIAETRANIKFLRHIRNCEFLPQFKILKHLYSNIQTSKSYNPNSYEAKMLRSQIHAIEKDLAAINKEIDYEKKFLKDYINGKDKMFKRLRAKNQ